ncbi:HDOD domain-containing protein [Marinomonas mediterranea]|uniref:HDOD domain-containing protein n=1 Tax=Marinomonas mediterranea TaxID=119864 RepID=UPI00234BB659|nr:HDOD domain-containing protein [Marinomonas mediterranea]WCN11431.1 HDOD domain-containing protein [Marinomonas mediterranea]
MNKSPFNLEEWLIFLKDKKFPVEASNLARLKNQIKSPYETLDRMRSNIASEPLLAFAILNEANKVVPNKRSDIKTPNHAASMIGMSGIERVLDQLEPYEYSRKNPEQNSFLKEIQVSYEAAAIAKRWAIEKNISHIDDVFWVTFFRNAVRWLLWFHANEQMTEITHQLKKGISATQAELEHLGCRIDELTVKMMQYWQAPEIVINSFLTKHIPSAKELQSLANLTKHADQIPGFSEDKRLTILANGHLILSYCASKVAQEADVLGWGSKQLVFFYRVIAAVLHDKLGKVIQATHYGAVEAAAEFISDAKPPLARQLLSPLLYTKTSQIRATKKSDITPEQQLRKALEAPGLSNKQKAALVMKVIRVNIRSAQHTIIFKYSESKGALSPILQYGYDIEVIKAIKWNNPSTTFDRLKQKRTAVLLSDKKLQQVLKTLPDTSDQIVDDNGNLILASTPVSEGEHHIYWLETRKAFSENDYKIVKQLLTIVSQ